MSDRERKAGISGRYQDIIDLPHHVSRTHPQMPVRDRAAQFAPFAALTGYEAAVKETARRTEEKIELDESQKAILNEKLVILQEQLQSAARRQAAGDCPAAADCPAAPSPAAAVTYFRPDEKKAGGAYITVSGHIKKIDAYERVVIMEDGTRIPIDDLAEIRGLQDILDLQDT